MRGFLGQRPRALGEALHRPLESGAIGGIDHLGEPSCEVESARGDLFVDRAPSHGERQKGFAQVRAVGATGHELALLELRHGPRHLRLMHLAVGADRLAGHDPELTERDQHPPFRDAEAVALHVDARQCLRYQACQHVEAIGQEVLELERRLLARARMGLLPLGRDLVHRRSPGLGMIVPLRGDRDMEDGGSSWPAQRPGQAANGKSRNPLFHSHLAFAIEQQKPMTEIKVLSARAPQMALQNLFADFTRATSHGVTQSYGTVGAIADRFKAGEAADLLILSPSALAALGDAVVPGSQSEVARAGLAVCVRAGTGAPDLSTPQAFTAALLAARAVSYSDPKAGGSAAAYFATLLERLGIAQAVNAKIGRASCRERV